jgi:transmembrane sensor
MPTPHQPPNKQILEEAADWFVDFRDGCVDVTRRRAFNAWLRTSPQHIQAYLDVSAFWEDAPQVAAPPDLDIAALVAGARAEANVLDLHSPTADAPRAAAGTGDLRLSRRTALAASLALALLAAGALGGWLYERQHPGYRTGIGEQQSIVLADGSTVELNSRSRIRVHFTAGARNIDLLAGQALFRVAPDPARPFVVRSDTTRVRAVGTRFDMYRRGSGTTVTVIEGRVAIDEADLQLIAGEQVIVTAAAVSRPQPANLATATAWTQRRLIFQSASLDEVAEEFNRYNRRQLVVAGPGLDDFHMSGVFSSTDPASLLRFLRERFDVRIEETTDQIRIFHKQ